MHFTIPGIANADVGVPTGGPEEADPQARGGLFVARIAAGFHASRGDRLRIGINLECVRLFDRATGESLLRNGP